MVRLYWETIIKFCEELRSTKEDDLILCLSSSCPPNNRSAHIESFNVASSISSEDVKWQLDQYQKTCIP